MTCFLLKDQSAHSHVIRSCRHLEYLGCPHSSISWNALNLSLMEALFFLCDVDFFCDVDICFKNENKKLNLFGKTWSFRISKYSKRLLIFSFVGLKSFGSVKRFIDNTFEISTWIVSYFKENYISCLCRDMKLSSFLMDYIEYRDMDSHRWRHLTMPNAARQCCR